LRGGRLSWSALDVSVETATPDECSSTRCGLAVGRAIVGGDLLRCASGIEAANAFSSAEFSGIGWDVGGVGNPRVTDSEERESAGVRVVEEKGRATVNTLGREKEVYQDVN
jgi:hypothetical protein